jgi:hypothetical protein
MGFRALDVHIATAQAVIEVEEDTDFQGAPLEDRLPLPSGADEGLPPGAGEIERNRVGDCAPTRVLVLGLNIEKVSRTAKEIHFAVKAYFRQSWG